MPNDPHACDARLTARLTAAGDLPGLATGLWAHLRRTNLPPERQIDLLSVALESAWRSIEHGLPIEVTIGQAPPRQLCLILHVADTGNRKLNWLQDIAAAMHDEFELRVAPPTLELRHGLSQPLETGPSPALTAEASIEALTELACVIGGRARQLRRANLQLGEELEETNQGVLALYQELDEKAAKLSDLNETLEQRVAARTAEAEQRAVKLRAMALQLSSVEQQERRRLAETLHDHLQQLLVASKMRLSLVPSLKDEQVRPTLKQLEDLLDESIRITKDLTVQLSPPVLHHAGLPAALGWLAERMKQQHGITVAVSCDQNADDVDVNQQVKQLLFESVRELLFNTIKHADTDRAEVRCQLIEDQQFEVVVSDEGQGFLVEEIEAASGGGFGLLSVGERLECLGGRMTLESEPGRGTRARLIVPTNPREQIESGRVAPELPEPLPAAPEPVAGSPQMIRLMLADDHRIVREGLRAMLEAEEGVAIVGEADDGEQAVRLARDVRPDGIIMDVNMPRMDGIAATRHIHRQWPQIKVIGLSMHHEQEIFDAMRDAGAVACLRKDEAGSELMALLHRVITSDPTHAVDAGCEDDEAAATAHLHRRHD